MVSRSLVKLMKAHPGTGWVRADTVPSEASMVEMLILRKRIDELEGVLASLRVEAPKGSDMLAQGEDLTTVHYTYMDGLSLKPKPVALSVKVTWNQIFGTLAPPMIVEASEESLKKALMGLVESHECAETRKARDLHAFASRPDVLDEDFQTIKVQLRALGLIGKSVKQHSVKDRRSYWSLTPYGDDLMTRLRAIRKDLSG